MNEISRQLRLLNDIVMYLEDEGHQISNRIIVNMNIEAEVEKIIAKGRVNSENISISVMYPEIAL